MTCFNTPTSIPKCVENISFCYDTTSLRKILDKDFARWTYQKKTLDKCHDFVVQRNKEGRACLQYKHKRYSDALLPRKFDVGGTYYSPTNGIGTVIQCSPEKDVITKEKFWNYTIRYEPDNALLIPAFQIPRAQKKPTYIVWKKRPPAVVGYGNRPIQVVHTQTYSNLDRSAAR